MPFCCLRKYSVCFSFFFFFFLLVFSAFPVRGRITGRCVWLALPPTPPNPPPPPTPPPPPPPGRERAAPPGSTHSHPPPPPHPPPARSHGQRECRHPVCYTSLHPLQYPPCTHSHHHHLICGKVVCSLDQWKSQWTYLILPHTSSPSPFLPCCFTSLA